MKYIVIDYCDGDVFTSEHETKKEAIAAAETGWNSFSEYDKNRRESFYVLKSVNPDPDGENHLDGNIIMQFK